MLRDGKRRSRFCRFYLFWSEIVKSEDAMGGEISKCEKREQSSAQRRLSHGFLSNVRVSIAHRLGHSATFSQPLEMDLQPSVSHLLLPPEDGGEMSDAEKAPPTFISVFLPEFPHCKNPAGEHFQTLGFIAKGSFGPILKIKDNCKEKIYAVKVLPKSEILKQGVLEQSKEEVIIQRQLKHPFIHNLQDCWQTQHHLFIMWDYCSTGDLYTYWSLKGQFGEEEVQLFAAELGSALGFLHDMGIIHRDLKMENILLSDREIGNRKHESDRLHQTSYNSDSKSHLRLSDFGLSRRLKRGGRAFTICGTIPYMAPEVLRGGPYNHAADWWSLGIMLFSLVMGEFPVAAEPDHTSMWKRVMDFNYVLPKTFSSALILLLTGLLCKDPVNRLRNLECFKMQAFFRGISFDPYMLQKTPVKFILDLRTHPDWASKSVRGASLDQFDSFDCNQIFNSPSTPCEPPPTHSTAEQTCKA
ncbi:ribosomal protein S6 kinase-related protein [Melanotaenia boesemani]|uniref:ribosomal protein S6 kinase-related protein n=1 Tax=Melanotaenia boesemani TaxID=1250792 RepID=UPI001C0435F2|nr:ribosomal protein S6 kinase-related protein [Melanotaenia boesemani]